MQNDDARKKAIGSHFSGPMCVGKQRDGRSLAHDEECGALHRGVQARYTNMCHGTASEVSNMVKFSVKRFLGGATFVLVPPGSGVGPSWCTCPPSCWKMTCRKLFVD